MLNKGITFKDCPMDIGVMTVLKKLLADNHIRLSRGGHYHQASKQALKQTLALFHISVPC